MNRLRRGIFGSRHKRLVDYTVGGIPLLIPVDHDLPYFRRLHPFYASNIGRLARVAAEKYSDLHLVDIGANVGDSAAFILSEIQVPILCVEGDPRFFAILSENAKRLGPSVHVDNSFVGRSSGPHEFRLEVGFGTSRMLPANGLGPVSLCPLPDILERHPLFATPKMVKIDTDGFDARILREERDVWARGRPILFFEYDPDLAADVKEDVLESLAGLKEIGYEAAMVYNHTGEYLLTIELADERTLRDVTAYFTGFRGTRYADLCAFHGDDADVLEQARTLEVRFFKNRRAERQGVSSS
ncbi:MAG: FkbM family methyltransferase [Planctomycetes bacterium]|nr:FkbM family methyltransferase [Planctomycetota bacterium]